MFEHLDFLPLLVDAHPPFAKNIQPTFPKWRSIWRKNRLNRQAGKVLSAPSSPCGRVGYSTANPPWSRSVRGIAGNCPGLWTREVSAADLDKLRSKIGPVMEERAFLAEASFQLRGLHRKKW
jgi:hypothetical protein